MKTTGVMSLFLAVAVIQGAEAQNNKAPQITRSKALTGADHYHCEIDLPNNRGGLASFIDEPANAAREDSLQITELELDKNGLPIGIISVFKFYARNMVKDEALRVLSNYCGPSYIKPTEADKKKLLPPPPPAPPR